MPSIRLLPLILLVALRWAGPAVAPSSQPGVTVIDLVKNRNTTGKLYLSDIAEEIEYVRLETTPECLFYSTYKFVVTDQYIIVGVLKKPVLVFDRNGKFLGNIGGIGKGPLEYSEVNNIVCDEQLDLVVILDNQQKKILKFNFSRQFIGSVSLSAYAVKMVLDGPEKIGVLYLPHNQFEKDTARFEWINGEGKILYSAKIYQNRPKDGGGLWSLYARVYKVDGQIHFVEVPYDTIYKLVDNTRFEPVWQIKIGSNKLPREVCLDNNRFSKEFQTYTFIDRLIETPDYFFIGGFHRQTTKTIFYNARERKAWSLKLQEGLKGFFLGRQGFHNDLDGGVPFWPTSAKDNYLVSITAPEVLIPAFKDKPEPVYPLTRPELRQKLFDIVGRLTENDNPVVVVVTLK